MVLPRGSLLALSAALLALSLGLTLAVVTRRLRGKRRKADIVAGLSGLIGHTPLVTIESLSRLTQCTILAKAELLNPGGSSKVGGCVCEAQ